MLKQPILEKIEPDILERLATRRDAILAGARASGSLVAALRLGSLPIALGALTRDVYGQAPSSVLDVLRFAFLLENLEAEFYKAALGQSSSAALNAAFAPVRGTLNAMEQATFDQIRKHEVAHVALLASAISSLGAAPPIYTAASFDFTGGNGSGNGPFAAATTDKAFLLAAAQAFEDTGVRAYKGQAGNLISNDAVLETALRIHAVEARHAAKIRKLRALSGVDISPTGTIVSESSGISGAPPAVQAAAQSVYEGEANTRHVIFNGSTTATINAANLPGIAQFGGTAAVTAAFDEPLAAAEVTAIVAPFVVGDGP